MFSLAPLLATEIMIRIPIMIAIPIKAHVVVMPARSPIFQSAARMPPTRKMKPTRYIPAHFMANLLVIGSLKHTYRCRNPLAAAAQKEKSAARSSFDRISAGQFPSQRDGGPSHERVDSIPARRFRGVPSQRLLRDSQSMGRGKRQIPRVA